MMAGLADLLRERPSERRSEQECRHAEYRESGDLQHDSGGRGPYPKSGDSG